jgi:hypothetical protein
VYKVTGKELDVIKKTVEEEFPGDPALQQLHIARKIIAREAEHEGLSYVEYIRSLRKRTKDTAPRSKVKKTLGIRHG